MKLLSFLTLFIPCFIFLALFEPAFELYLDFFDVTRHDLYHIYANSRGTSPLFTDFLFSGFFHPDFCLVVLVIALPTSIAGIILMRKKPRINIFVLTLFITLILVSVYYIVYLIPALTYYDRKNYNLKLTYLGITGFILLLPFSFIAKRLLRKASKSITS